MAEEQHVGIVGKGGGEDVGVAAVGKFEALAQFGCRQWEVPHGDVGLFQSLQLLADFPLVEGRDAVDAELPTGEFFDEIGKNEQMAVL